MTQQPVLLDGVEYDNLGEQAVSEFKVADLIGYEGKYEITVSERHPKGWHLEWKHRNGEADSVYIGDAGAIDNRWVPRAPKFFLINEAEEP